jgi:hypothetical protein
MMKKAVFVFLCITSGLILSAQQNRFIYIQTENKQLFYVRLDKKVFSSTGSGYVIIPKLTDGAYQLTVGFPKNEWTEQSIPVVVDKKDAGYLLKNFGEKGWGLFNIQSMELRMAGSGGAVTTKTEDKGDAFSTILSNVAKDSTIRKKPVAETPVVATTPPAAVVAPEMIRKLMGAEGQKGMEMIYTVEKGAFKDTIRLFIPADEAPVVKPTPKEPEKEITIPVADAQPANPKQAEPVVEQPPVTKPTPKEPEKELPTPADTLAGKPKQAAPVHDKPPVKFIEMELPNPNSPEKATPVMAKSSDTTTAPKKEPLKMVNSNCRNFATNDDFLKLRKKMAAEEAEDEMVAIAKKTFKTKCFTTEQIRNLGVLFLKDADRYNFFYTAYAWASDSENYPALQSQLTDEYYINLFKAMIRH